MKFVKDKFSATGLTFDDVLLLPKKSSVLPSETDVSTHLTKHLRLNIPLVSAAMDTVTESKLAIALAQAGGIGIIHKNLTIERQAAEIDLVKRAQSGMIVHPITLSPDRSIKEAVEIMKKYNISGLTVTDDGKDNGKLVGILTNRDMRFVKKLVGTVAEYMTKDLITTGENTPMHKALDILYESRIEKLPVVDKHFRLKGLITIKDIEKKIEHPLACKDKIGRLLVGGAVGTSKDTEERVDTLVKAGADLISIDTAHGHSMKVMDILKMIKKKYPNMQTVAGNVASPEAVKDLIRKGADAVKVGMGPGSICTTRIIAGIGVPQVTAVYECSKAAKKYGIPIIADGGIKYSGDVTKAIAAGADCVMIGSLFAGTDESPGETVFLEGRRFKIYDAMGSIAAMKRGSKDRYFQENIEQSKLVPEGVEARVPYRGSVGGCVLQLIGGLKSGMGYCGAKNIKELQQNSEFIKITAAGLKESHPHNIMITSEPPNYWL